MRLAACFGVPLDIIEPCGFVLSDAKLRRAGMDYARRVDLVRHESWERFRADRTAGRVVLLTTKATVTLAEFAFRPDDLLLFRRRIIGRSGCGPAAADAEIRSHAGRRAVAQRRHLRRYRSLGRAPADRTPRNGPVTRRGPSRPGIQSGRDGSNLRLFRRCRRRDRRVQGLIEIGDDIVDMLDTHRQADITVGDAGNDLILRRKLAMGGAGRVFASDRASPIFAT